MRSIPPEVTSHAEFSPDQRYRFVLTRAWDILPSSYAMFVGLNPSTATAEVDDPTVQKCWRWSRAWGFGSFAMLNVYAYRARDPRALRAVEDPVGAGNDALLSEYARGAALVVAAWGVGIGDRERLRRIRELLSSAADVHCLGENDDGSPRHPLYLPRDTQPRLWATRATRPVRCADAGAPASRVRSRPAR
jgi:hypothetical protein